MNQLSVVVSESVQALKLLFLFFVAAVKGRHLVVSHPIFHIINDCLLCLIKFIEWSASEGRLTFMFRCETYLAHLIFSKVK